MAPVRTYVSVERVASIIRVNGISELEAASAVTTTLVTDDDAPSSLIRFTQTMEATRSSETSHEVISQNTAFFIVTAVKTSNLT
jgi:hypothetical protein